MKIFQPGRLTGVRMKGKPSYWWIHIQEFSGMVAKDRFSSMDNNL